jgi:hypothetical protein
MRLIVRKERPYHGAQLRFTDADGMRVTAFATHTQDAAIAALELRHRQRARRWLCPASGRPQATHRPSGWGSGATAGLTVKPHLPINEINALGTGPLSRVSLTAPLRGQAATLERLGIDRKFEETLTHSSDPSRGTGGRRVRVVSFMGARGNR